jgi:hypothetical protein
MQISRALRGLLLWMIRSVGSMRPTRIEPLFHSKLRVGPRSEFSRDTVEGCRDRAAADLQDADASTNPHERKQLRRGAKRWSLRADMLERLAKSFRKRAALDDASRQYHRDKERQSPRRPGL